MRVVFAFLSAATLAGTPGCSPPDFTGIEHRSRSNSGDIDVVAPAGLRLVEGESTELTFALTVKPTAPVSIASATSDETEGQIVPPKLKFTVDNWDTPQSATLGAINDDTDDGDVEYMLLFTVASDDPAYATLTIPNIAAKTLDDDAVGVTLSSDTVSVHELGTSDSFTVRLDSEPFADVTITLESSDSTECALSETELLFTPTTWSQPKTITVTGIPERGLDGDVESQINLTADSSDAAYQGTAIATVSITTRDFVVERISETSTHELADAASGRSALSSDGSAVFESYASLVPADDNDARDVYHYDRNTRALTLLSVDVEGNVHRPSGTDAASAPQITPDGRFVAFATPGQFTSADTDVAGWDVYVKDLRPDGGAVYDLVSPDCPDCPGDCENPGISADARYVVMDCWPGKRGTGAAHAYRYDRLNRAIDLVLPSTPEAVNTWDHFGQISSTGNKTVTIASLIRQLPGGHSSSVQLAVRDFSDDGPVLLGTFHALNAEAKDKPSISGDGNTIAYSAADGQIVVEDLPSAEPSTRRGGVVAKGEWTSLSADGRYLSFVTGTPPSADTPGNGRDHVYVLDRELNRLARASLTDEGKLAAGDSRYATLSPDGSAIIFASDAANIVAGDDDQYADVYVIDLDDGFWSTAVDF